MILGLALLVPLVISLVALSASTTRSQDVAASLAEPVAQRVLADARERNIAAARGELDRANARLVSRGLPIVPQPGDDATSTTVQIQAARAFVLADLPEDIAQAIRDDVAAGTAPDVFPSMLTVPIAPPGGDRVVTVLPGVEGRAPAAPRRPGGGSSDSGSSGSAPRNPSSGTPGGSAPTGRAPSPAPAPAPTQPPRGLLPDLPGIPRLPLLGG